MNLRTSIGRTLGSRKYMVQLITIVLIFFFGDKLSEEQILALAGTAAAYMASQGWVDAKEKAANPGNKPPGFGP